MTEKFLEWSDYVEQCSALGAKLIHPMGPSIRARGAASPPKYIYSVQFDLASLEKRVGLATEDIDEHREQVKRLVIEAHSQAAERFPCAFPDTPELSPAAFLLLHFLCTIGYRVWCGDYVLYCGVALPQRTFQYYFDFHGEEGQRKVSQLFRRPKEARYLRAASAPSAHVGTLYQPNPSLVPNYPLPPFKTWKEAE